MKEKSINTSINAQSTEIAVMWWDDEDYISLTDIPSRGIWSTLTI